MPIAYDVQPAKLPDEILAVLAQCGYSPARSTVTARHAVEVGDLVHGYLAKYPLPPSCGHADAAQNAVISLDRAITKYDTNELGKRQGCSFRTFLYKVVTRRLQNFVRDARRGEKHLDRSVDAELAADAKAARRRRSPADDPAEALTEKETLDALAQAVSELDADTQVLVKEVLTGKNYTQAGRDLGLTVEAARWRWHKALKVLRKKMKKYGEE